MFKPEYATFYHIFPNIAVTAQKPFVVKVRFPLAALIIPFI